MTAERSSLATFVEIFALALWLGASLFFAAVVAPAAFAVLPGPGLAGALVGRVLPTLFFTGMVVGAIIIALEIRARHAGSRLRGAGAAVMLTACAAAQFVIGGRIERLRSAAGSPIAALAKDDPRRVTFGRLHGLSVAALGAAMIGAAAAAAGARSAHVAKG